MGELIRLASRRLGDSRLGGANGSLRWGYSVVSGGPAGQDDYRWICAIAFEDRRDSFDWTVLGV